MDFRLALIIISIYFWAMGFLCGKGYESRKAKRELKRIYWRLIKGKPNGEDD